MKKPELLAPAGSFEKAKTAFLYGADAVYAGTSSLSLRTRAEMGDNDLEKTIEYAHSIGKKVYTAINIYAWDENYEEIVYEGYGPAGVAVIVEASTNNRNRTAADVRHVFDKAGGNLGTSGCVSYMFNKKGVIVIEKESTDMDEEELMMLALDAGAEDFTSSDDVYEITTDPSNFSEVREKLEQAGLTFLEADVQMVPTTTVSLDDDGAEKMERLIERLEELDDVMDVYHNWDM